MTQNNVGIYASQISGHLWAPNGAYDALATTTVASGGAASITFTGIPQGYKHLQLRAVGKSVPADTSAGYDITCYFNGDSTLANYYNHYLYGNSDTGAIGSGVNVNNAIWGGVVGASPANVYSTMIMDILDYSSSSKYKVGRMIEGFETRTGGTNLVIVQSTNWSNTAPITSITFNVRSGTGFAEHTRFALYGVK